MSERGVIATLFAYFLIGVLTFGYAAAHLETEDSLGLSAHEKKVGAGLMAGIFWPMYWSWEAWE